MSLPSLPEGYTVRKVRGRISDDKVQESFGDREGCS